MAYYPTDSSYQELILDRDIALIWPFFASGADIAVTDIMDISASSGGHKIILPNATLTSNGQNLLFNNIGGFSFDIIADDGITVIVSVDPGDILFLYLYDFSTSNGLWRVIPFGGGVNAITAITAHSSDASVLITDGSVTPPGGVIDFKLTGLLSNLIDQSNSGFPVITEYPEWDIRTLTAGSNIEITNPDGKFGDPIVNLSSAITNLTSLLVGNFAVSGSNIDASEQDTDLNMTTNGSGKLIFNGVAIDVDSNIVVNDLTVNGTFNNPLMLAAWCVFTDTVTGVNNTIITEDSQNVASITGSNGSYTITFTNPMASINYGVTISVGSNGATLPPPVYHGMWTIRDTTSLAITIVDSSGEFVTSVPDGVTVTVMSS